jgi:hypothetical protein
MADTPMDFQNAVEEHREGVAAADIEAWTFSAADFANSGYQEQLQRLQAQLATLKQRGVQSFTYGWLIGLGHGLGFGFPAWVRFAEDRTFAGSDLNDLTSAFEEVGRFVLSHAHKLLPADVAASNVFMNLAVNLGDEQSDPTITGVATSVAIDGEFMLQPVRLL